MPNSTQEEKLRWITPILEKRMKIKDLALVCPFSERAIKYWLKQYRERGIDGLVNKSTRPKSQPNETPIRIKERIIEIRKEEGIAAIKIHWRLEKEGISIHERTTGKILKIEGLTRKYRSRKQYPPKTKTPLRTGELVEIDIKYVPDKLSGKRYYQFTAIDCASKWRYLEVYDDYGSNAAVQFLKKLIKIAPFEIKAIKTDNAPCFTNRYVGYQKSTDPFTPRLHQFDLECQRSGIIHYLIDPGKPAQNGAVEKSHGSDQRTFYDRIKYRSVEELRYKLRLWNMYYNDLEHCGLNGLTPNEYLKLKVQNVRT